MKKLVVLGSLFSLLISTNAKSAETTYQCFISNERLISSSIYEFDVFIQSTSVDFKFRTFQGCFTFDAAFLSNPSAVHAGYVPGSTQLLNYTPNKIEWNADAKGFQVASNQAGTCNTGTMITTTTPVRIGTFRIATNGSSSFNSVPAKAKIVRINDANSKGLVLKMAVTKWDANDCATGTSTTIVERQASTTGVKQVATEGEISIYPSPATTILYVTSGNDQIKSIDVLNAAGQKSDLKYSQVKKGGTTELNVAGLAPGVYFLDIITENGKELKKFVKE